LSGAGRAGPRAFDRHIKLQPVLGLERRSALSCQNLQRLPMPFKQLADWLEEFVDRITRRQASLRRRNTGPRHRCRIGARDDGMSVVDPARTALASSQIQIKFGTSFANTVDQLMSKREWDKGRTQHQC
jgi:hypothetical protein